MSGRISSPTKDGSVHKVDIIVLATGFQASRMLQSIEVKGKGGHDIRELWGEDDPRAYLGITVPGFPNFFVMYGPNTNLGGGGNIIFHGECQANYIVSALRRTFESGHGTIEVNAGRVRPVECAARRADVRQRVLDAGRHVELQEREGRRAQRVALAHRGILALDA